jgi:CelD/BcsL family acetyltransferase involved in cellulose biosynthesis
MGVEQSSVLPLVEPFANLEAAGTDDPVVRPAEATLPGPLYVERVEAGALIGYHAAWDDLCQRLLEPNVFLQPAFALPLLQHIVYPKRPSVLLVWEENGPASFGRLLGLFPLHLAEGAPRFDGIVRGFLHRQTGCGVPLVDRDQAGQAIEAALGWLAADGRGRTAAVVFRCIPRDGAFFAELQRVCAVSARGFVELDGHRRAILYRRPEGGQKMLSFTSAKHRKERARQFRRLSEAGRRAYVSAHTPKDVATATERFLALEHNGWKGARRTALLADPAAATFTRTMTRLMAHEGRCRIDSIEIDGRPVAMGIILRVGDRASFWKTAFDETYAPLSPGVQFAIEMTQVQLADASLVSTDSCAIANHPMIDRLWPERLAMTDVVLAVEPTATRRFARCVRLETLRRAARQAVKTAGRPTSDFRGQAATGAPWRRAKNRTTRTRPAGGTCSGSTNGFGSPGW